jgi:outer membrane protein OmpA-like peptidoglycan-associated protein
MRTTVACAVLAAMLGATGACRPKVAPGPADLIVLMPDPDDGGHVGSATVTGKTGSVELTEPQTATRVVGDAAPTAPAPIAAEEIQRLFGEVLAARPLPPRQFLLYFQTGTEQLTVDSLALVPDVVKVVRDRPAADVTVIGHTDTTGDAASNFDLGMRRAVLIRDLLVKSGLDPAKVSVASHGEADLLVKTPDDTAEPKNRCVEVTVR